MYTHRVKTFTSFSYTMVLSCDENSDLWDRLLTEQEHDGFPSEESKEQNLSYSKSLYWSYSEDQTLGF